MIRLPAHFEKAGLCWVRWGRRELEDDGRQEGLGKSGVSDGGYELVGSGGACGAGSMDVESSHRLSSPILGGKIRTLNKNEDDNDDDEQDSPSQMSHSQKS